jgi:hypothetical protein
VILQICDGELSGSGGSPDLGIERGRLFRAQENEIMIVCGVNL